MNLKEAAQQALEVLEESVEPWEVVDYGPFAVAISALRDALAEDAMQRLTDVQQKMEATGQESRQVEPVAVWELQESGWEIICDGDWVKELPFGTKLYTAPPKREPLTEDEIDKAWRSVDYKISYDNFRIEVARAIERAIEAKSG